MPGPLPNSKARRRNAPTIPTTELPAGGRVGRSPNPPKRIELGDAGKEWWSWAWHTPQAAAWDGGGFDEVIARRAVIEDDLAALAAVESLDALQAIAADESGELRQLVGALAGLVTGKLSLMREARELDDRLGLSPKALAALRWQIVEPIEAGADDSDDIEDEVGKRRAARMAAALDDEEAAPAPTPTEKPATEKKKAPAKKTPAKKRAPAKSANSKGSK